MKEHVESLIKLAVESGRTADEALKFTQAALNAANAIGRLEDVQD